MAKYYLFMTLLMSLAACSGDKPYNEHANAKAVIEQAASEAKLQKKPMIIIFGANWCPDCRAVSNAIENGKDATKIAKEFKIVKVNVGDFNKNIEVANSYGNPIAGGIPGAAILTFDHKLLYVTHPGELSTAIRNSENGVYSLFRQHTASPVI
ncbi:MAG TPA: thioredoxin family protein [Methylotenera sp.]|nr:thioredoxin family protein [Methylotenera sp.]HPH06031.1 thioredoxin family protein [Methylotenera sp.]HPN00609.1 thioredoxin family protein [Methylotenera sp.]